MISWWISQRGPEWLRHAVIMIHFLRFVQCLLTSSRRFQKIPPDTPGRSGCHARLIGSYLWLAEPLNHIWMVTADSAKLLNGSVDLDLGL